MKILITSANTKLASHLASALRSDHDVVLTSRTVEAADKNITHCNLGHDDSTNDLVRGMDVIIHSGTLSTNLSIKNHLDNAMRCTYNLLWAASEERVPKFIYLSSLSVMDRYDESFVVTERWKPAPATDIAALSYHLGEFVCREFARENKISIVSLRMGSISWDEKEVSSSSTLYLEDALQSVLRVICSEFNEGYAGSTTNWKVFHIQSAVANSRFITTTSEQALGYEPMIEKDSPTV